MSVHFLVTTGADREPGTVSTDTPAKVSTSTLSNDQKLYCLSVLSSFLSFSRYWAYLSTIKISLGLCRTLC